MARANARFHCRTEMAINDGAITAVEGVTRVHGPVTQPPAVMRELLERHAASRGRSRRGWLVQRALLVADVVGLMVAFVTVAVVLGPGEGEGNALAVAGEYALFVATLPGWILVAKLHGLYDHDEERTDHTTLDDFVGVFHVVTIGVWVLYRRREADWHWPIRSSPRSLVLGTRDPARHGRAGVARARCRRRAGVRAEHDHRRRRGGRPARSAQARAASRVRHQLRRVRRRGAARAPRGPRHLPMLGAARAISRSSFVGIDVDRVIVAFSNETPEEIAPLIGRLREASTSRSTSSRGSSTSSARTSTCTRSRACRSSGSRRASCSRSRARSSASSTSSAPCAPARR